MKTLTVKGSNFECGLETGKLFSDIIHKRIEMFKLTDSFIEENDGDIKKMHAICNKVFPQYIKEIEGMAQGAKTDYRKLFFMNCTELLYTNKCSSIAVNSKDEMLLAHNEDADWFEKKSNFAVVRFKIGNSDFHSFFYPGELAGCAYGWNSAGVISTVNNLRDIEPDLAKIPRNFIARAILDAKTTDEALEIIKKTPCSSGYHYFLADRNRILSVEQLHGEAMASEVSGFYAHTNHFLLEKFKAKKANDNSKIRLDTINRLRNNNVNTLEILFNKENRPNPVFNQENDAAKTVSTFVCEPKKNRIRVYDSDSETGFFEFKITEG